MSAAEQLSEAPARRRRRISPRVERLHLSVAPRTVALLVLAGVVMGAGLLAVGYQLGVRAAGPASGPVAAVHASPAAPAPKRSSARPVVSPASKAAPVAELAKPAAAPPGDAQRPAAEASAAAEASSPVGPAPALPTPSETPVKAPPVVLKILAKAPSRGYGVQIGAYEDELEARAFIDSVAGGLGAEPVHLIAAEVADGRVWYRIRVGHYRSRRRAAAAQAKLPEDLAKASMVVRYR